MANAPYIALADDDPDDQDMLAERIRISHPDILFKFFQNGLEIARFLEDCPLPDLPTLLILDYQMPRLTGADVLKGLQGNDRYKIVRKIVWSTSDGPSHQTPPF